MQRFSRHAGAVQELICTAVTSRWFRVLVATFGGYAFTVGFFALFAVSLALLGVGRVEAMWWSVLTSFLIFTVVVVWVAATPHPGRATLAVLLSSFAMITGAPRLAGMLV
ncbi:MAG: hypothetical protein AAF662_03280 [Pseudomonadota bacterium]